MATRHFILATAGHVDHGKSALVQTLTGVNPDRLLEEKRRGISIELGFAELRLASGADQLSIGIVDVPGHEDFVKTMTVGVAAANGALIVIAANEGVMPQTLEHLEILELLGVTSGLIALTKIDLVTDLATATSAVREHLAGTAFARLPIVPISVRQPATIESFKAAIVQMVDGLAPPTDIGKPRLWIDRAFALKGAGTVVTGSLIGGTLRKDQSVTLQPVGTPAAIRAIHAHRNPIDLASPGMRIALNLPALTLSNHGTGCVERGQMISIDSTVERSQLFDAQLLRSTMSGDRNIREGCELHVLLGSACLSARAHLFCDNRFARFKLASPAPILVGERFVLRDASNRHTLGGGVILDPHPPKTRGWRKDAGQNGLLIKRSQSCSDARMLIASLIERDGWANCSSLHRALLVSTAQVDQALDVLLAEKKIVQIGEIGLEQDRFASLSQSAHKAVADYHHVHPQRGGIPLTELRENLAAPLKKLKLHKLADAIVAKIFAEPATTIERVGNLVRRQNFHAALPPRLQATGQRLTAVLDRGNLTPPTRSELARSDVEQETLRFLIATGVAVDLGNGVVLSSSAFKAAAQRVRQHLAVNGAATVSELKTLLASSRRVMIPLLERFDRDGVTLRNGDLRRLSPVERPAAL